jgi:cathepsin L
VKLSEQQLVDCSGSYGNLGCNGGLMDNAFKYTQKYGIESEANYGYKAVDGSCKYNASKVVFKNSGFVDVPARNLDQLAAAVNLQPVSVAVDAESWQFYSSGIYSANCGTSLDHGVLLVGYGSESGKDYWIVRNSWGTSWGENGYIRLKKTSGKGTGECGIALSASYPTLN